MRANSKQSNSRTAANSNFGATNQISQSYKNPPAAQTTQLTRSSGLPSTTNKNNSTQMSSILNSNSSYNNASPNIPQYQQLKPTTTSNQINNVTKPITSSNSSSSKYNYETSAVSLANNQIPNLYSQSQYNNNNYQLPDKQSQSNQSKYLSDVGDLRAKNQIEQQQKILSYDYKNQQSQSNESQKNDSPPQYQSGKGIVGLRNIGNTCFMNSVLQCLANTPSFNEKLIQEIQSSYKSVVSNAYAKFVTNYRQAINNSAENPSELKRAIERTCPQFSGYSQQDAQELMIELLEAINQEMNRVKTKPVYQEMSDQLDNKTLEKLSQEWWDYQQRRENSVVQDFFTGQILNKVICQQCNFSAVAFDNFSDISLAITRSLNMLDDFNIDRLIKEFLKEETIDDYFCKRCKGLKKSKRQFFFFRLPKILIFQIKRFNFRRFGSDKLNHKITFPIKGLNMKEYLSKDSNQSYQYDLFGVVNHSGTISGGHYTADCKSIVDNQWYRFNDSQVTPINIDNQPYNMGGSSAPYILFYCRQDSQEKR